MKETLRGFFFGIRPEKLRAFNSRRVNELTRMAEARAAVRLETGSWQS